MDPLNRNRGIEPNPQGHSLRELGKMFFKEVGNRIIKFLTPDRNTPVGGGAHRSQRRPGVPPSAVARGVAFAQPRPAARTAAPHTPAPVQGRTTPNLRQASPNQRLGQINRNIVQYVDAQFSSKNTAALIKEILLALPPRAQQDAIKVIVELSTSNLRESVVLERLSNHQSIGLNPQLPQNLKTQLHNVIKKTENHHQHTHELAMQSGNLTGPQLDAKIMEFFPEGAPILKSMDNLYGDNAEKAKAQLASLLELSALTPAIRAKTQELINAIMSDPTGKALDTLNNKYWTTERSSGQSDILSRLYMSRLVMARKESKIPQELRGAIAVALSRGVSSENQSFIRLLDDVAARDPTLAAKLAQHVVNSTDQPIFTLMGLTTDPAMKQALTENEKNQLQAMISNQAATIFRTGGGGVVIRKPEQHRPLDVALLNRFGRDAGSRIATKINENFGDQSAVIKNLLVKNANSPVIDKLVNTILNCPTNDSFDNLRTLLTDPSISAGLSIVDKAVLAQVSAVAQQVKFYAEAARPAPPPPLAQDVRPVLYKRHSSMRIERSILHNQDKVSRAPAPVRVEGRSNIARATGPSGIRNIGNSCYINTSFQLILQDPNLREGLKNLSEGAPPLGPEFQRLFSDYDRFQSQGAPADPAFANRMKQLLSKFLAQTGDHQSAAQLLTNKEYDATHVISRLYGGLAAAGRLTANTGISVESSRAKRPLYVLSLSGQHHANIQGALDHLEDDDVREDQGVELERSPITLTAMPTSFSVAKTKPKDGVDLKEPILEVKIKAKNGQSQTYECDYFSIHSGETERSGHWFSYRKVGGKWFEMNDAYATEIIPPRSIEMIARGGALFHYAKKE